MQYDLQTFARLVAAHGSWLEGEPTGAKAMFDMANLSYATFDGMDLRRASFRDANLTGASFRDADLTGAIFYGADLSGADFTGAKGAPELNGKAESTPAEAVQEAPKALAAKAALGPCPGSARKP